MFQSTTAVEVIVHILGKESTPRGTQGLSITSQHRVTRKCGADITNSFKYVRVSSCTYIGADITNSFKYEDIDLSRWDLQDLQKKPKNATTSGIANEKTEDLHPFIIQLKELGDSLDAKNEQSQYTFCALDTQVQQGTNQYKVIPYSQKHQYGDIIYDLHEIYGIERRRPEQTSQVSGVPNGRECVICLAAERDTAVLPCRHMCLCSECANIMRMQSKTCPVCRQHVESLFQISEANVENEEGNA